VKTACRSRKSPIAVRLRIAPSFDCAMNLAQMTKHIYLTIEPDEPWIRRSDLEKQFEMLMCFKPASRGFSGFFSRGNFGGPPHFFKGGRYWVCLVRRDAAPQNSTPSA